MVRCIIITPDGSASHIYQEVEQGSFLIRKEVQWMKKFMRRLYRNSEQGKFLYQHLRNIPSIDSEYIQFGCAQWFWERQVNSYALQVEPKRYMMKDRLSIDYWEALHIEKVKNNFLTQLKKLVQDLIDSG